MSLSDIWNKCVGWCDDHSTQILTGAAAVGVVTTGVLAFRAGTKAAHILEAKREDWEDTDPDDSETKRTIIFEAAKEMAPSLLPAIAVGAFTIVCGIKSHSISAARISTLTSLVSMSAKEIKDINDELVDSFGDKKAKQIRDKAMQRRFNKEHPNDEQECKYLIDCGGDVLCCDIYGDVYFMSTHEEVKQAIENLAYQCADEGNVTLNDLYLKLHIPPKDWANSIIWSYRDLTYEVDNFGYPRPHLPIETTTILGFNDKPCLGIRYDCDSVCY